MNPLRIFIVDDHQLVIDGIQSLLSSSEKYAIAGFSRNPEKVADLLQEIEVDVLLTDVSMPVISGIELTRLIKKKYPSIKVIAISMHGNSDVIKEMLDSGISGYILKNTGRAELLAALDKVVSGGTYFDENVTRELINNFGKKDEECRLTNREIEIIRLISNELSNKQISDKLFISERTVETHRKNIFRKTSTQSVVGLLKYAYSHKII